MRHAVDIARLFVDIETDRFVEHWVELNLHEVFQQMGAIPDAGVEQRYELCPAHGRHCGVGLRRCGVRQPLQCR